MSEARPATALRLASATQRPTPAVPDAPADVAAAPAPETDSVAALLVRAEDHWRAQGSRLTQVRRLVCTAAFSLRATFRADALLAASRRLDRGISSTSVYRILSDLVAAELLHATPGPDGHRLYTVAAEKITSLGHILCTDCGQVFPLDDPCLALRSTPVVRRQGFRARNLSLRVEAECTDHRNGTRCARRAVAAPPGIHPPVTAPAASLPKPRR